MIRKSRVVLLSALLGGAFVLAACGDSSEPATGSAEPVTLTFWNGFTGPDGEALTTLVDQYNESQDQVTIDMEIMPWDVFFDRLLPALSAGEGPDFIAMNSQRLAQFVDAGAFAAVDDFYEQTGLKDDLARPAVEALELDGQMYGVPLNYTSLLLYWNKTMFEEAGLDPEDPPDDWGEWHEYAKKLTVDENNDGTPEQYGYAIADHGVLSVWPILMWNNGGGVVSDDGKPIIGSDASIQAVDTWARLIQEHDVSPVGLSGPDADKLFQTEKAAMEIVGPWMTKGFSDVGIDFGLAMVPAGPAAQQTLANVSGFAISVELDENQRSAAFDFFEYWNSADSQVYWSTETGFPPLLTSVSDESLADNPHSATFKQYADQARPYLRGVVSFNEVHNEIFLPAIQRILNGEGNAEEVLTQAQTELEAVLGDSAG